VGGQCRVEAEFAEGRTVAPHVGDERAGNRVGQHRTGRTRLAVVADVQHRVDVGGEPGHHPVGPRCPPHQFGPLVQQFGHQVPEPRVRVGDQHLRVRRIRVHPPHRGIGLRGQQRAVALVLAVTGADVIVADHPGNALHVDRHEYPHLDHTFPSIA
jgi:hypothetical protein